MTNQPTVRAVGLRPWWIVLTIGGMIAAGAVWCVATRQPPVADLPKPDRLLEQALAIVVDHPEEAEALVRQAIDRSGGDFDDAELTLATICGGTERWPEALRLLEQIDLAGCRTELLMAFGR
ncbi:MAG: hypothetical protein EHM42_14775, partial [Planctomycetaceae bacterium]